MDDEEALPDGPPEIIKLEDPPTLRDVLSYQTTLNLVVYTLLALYTLAYDQVCFSTSQEQAYANLMGTASSSLHAPSSPIHR